MRAKARPAARSPLKTAAAPEALPPTATAAPTPRLLQPAAVQWLAAHQTAAVAGLWLCSRALMMFFLSPNQDVQRYYDSAGAWLQGVVPYVGFTFEYPPGALPLFALVRPLASSPAAYGRLFALQMLAVDVGILWLLRRLPQQLFGARAAAAPARQADTTCSMLLYVGCTALLRSLAIERYDLCTALLVLGWLSAVAAGRRLWRADLALAAGIFAKLVPAAALPLYGAWAWAHGRDAAASLPQAARHRVAWRHVAQRLGGCVAALALATLPFAWQSGTALRGFIDYHRERSLQIESLWSGALLLAHNWGGLPLRTEFAFGCTQLAGSLSQALAQVAAWATPAAVLGISVLFGRRLLAAPDPTARALRLVQGTAALLVAFVCLNKVLSPQYLLWLAPVLPLLLHRGGPTARPLMLGLVAAFFGTALIFVFYYIDLLRLDPLPTLVLVARNGVLLATLWVLLEIPLGEGARRRLHDPLQALLRRPAWGAVGLALCGLWAFVANLSETTANDIWIQLRSGADIVASGQLPTTEVYSATVFNRPFIAHEWLSGVIFHGLVSAFGGAGLSFLAAAVGLVAMVLLYFVPSAEARRQAWFPCLLLMAVYLVSFRILVRPHIFTIVAQSALLLALERWRRRGAWRELVWLVPLQLVWVNLHGAALFGPALVATMAAVVAGMVLVPSLQRGSETRPFGWRDVGQLAGTAVAMALSCLINPYGARLITFSLDLLDNPYAKARVWEWTPPLQMANVNYYWMWLYVAVLALMWLSVLVRLRSLPVLDTVLAAVVTFLSLRANRFVPDLAIFSFPVIARSALALSEAALPAVARGRRPWLEIGACSLLLGNAVTYGYAHSAREHRPPVGWGFGGDMPYQEAAILKRLGARGTIFNEYSDGALLIHELYPDVRVVLDSRIDLYPLDVVGQYDDAYMDPRAFRRYIEQRRINYILLYRYRAHPAILAGLAQDRGWQQLSQTANRVLYRRRAPLAAGRSAQAEATMPLFP